MRYQRGAEADDDKGTFASLTFFNADGYATAVLEAENELRQASKRWKKSAGVEVPAVRQREKPDDKRQNRFFSSTATA